MPLIIALVLVGHAAMHVGALACTVLSASMTPDLGADAATADALRATAVALTAVTVIGCLLAALAGVGVIQRRWWRPLVVVASAASATMLLGLFSPAAVPGLVIDAALLWAVLARSWQPSGAPRVRPGI